MKGDSKLLTIKELYKNLKEYNMLQNKYFNDFDLTEKEEDDILSQLDNLKNAINSFILSFGLTEKDVDNILSPIYIEKFLNVLEKGNIK